MIKLGDNLDFLLALPKESVDLVYLDPPFNKSRTFTGKTGEFEDRFDNQEHYLNFLRLRVQECHRILRPTGSLYLHCDSTANHIIRCMVEEVFSPKNFKNEIIWVRNKNRTQRNKHQPKSFGTAHDTILFFVKSPRAVFNLHETYSPLTPLALARFNHKDEKGIYGRFPPYRPLSLGKQPNLEYEFMGRRPPKDKAGWLGTLQHMQALRDAGDLEEVGQELYLKRRPSKGVPVNNIWSDIDPVKGDEKVDYPTQKPIALLERIIKVSTNPGDVVVDPFCGSGTTGVACQNLDRQFFGFDQNPDAYEIAKERLDNGWL